MLVLMPPIYNFPKDGQKLVREALIQRKVESHRLGARGMGERQPLVKGTSKTARAKNRRVEFPY